jgi:hypothetical protein
MREVGPQLRVRPLGVVPAHSFQVGPQVRYMLGAMIYSPMKGTRCSRATTCMTPNTAGGPSRR